MSVSRHFVLPLSPLNSRFYRGDNYSDPGGHISGLEVEYVFGKPWDELQDMVLSGEADVIPSLGANRKRQGSFGFTLPIETMQIAWMARSDSLITNFEPTLSIGAIVSSVAANHLEEMQVKNVKLFNSLQELLFGLLSGQTDIILAPVSNVRKLAQDARVIDKIRILTPPLFETKRGIALRPDDDALKETLNTAIEQFVSSREYLAIYDRWWSKPPPFWTPLKILIGAVASVLGLAISMFMWRYRYMQQTNSQLRSLTEQQHLQAASLEQEIVNRKKIEEALSADHAFLQQSS